MECEVIRGDDATIVQPTGKVDSSTAARFMTVLLGAVREGGLPVSTDLSRCAYMSSAGLRVLMIAHRELQARGQHLRVRGASPAVSAVIRLAGFDTIFEVEP
jgi:anti-sigma B factor antagonist